MGTGDWGLGIGLHKPITHRARWPVPSPRRPGLSLLHLLVVIAAAGAIFGIWISHFADTRRREYRGELEGALTTLAAAQSAYLAAHGRYAPDPATAGAPPPPRVTIQVGGAGLATGIGWAASGRHSSFPELRCRIAVGADTVYGGPAIRPNVVRCASEGQAPE